MKQANNNHFAKYVKMINDEITMLRYRSEGTHYLQIHVSIVRLDATQNLVIVPNIDQHLRIPLHGLIQNAERAGLEIGVRAGHGCCVGGHFFTEPL